MSNNLAKGIKWDLSDLYKSIDDPQIELDLKEALKLAIAFEKLHKPLMQKLSSAIPRNFSMAALLEDYKAILTLMTRLEVYASLAFAEQTDDQKRGAFMQRMRTEGTEIQSHLLFWEVIWNKLDVKVTEKIMNEAELKPHLHYLKNLRRWAPHTLNEGEEKVMAAMSNTGSSAFVRLFDETMNSLLFEIEVDGKTVKVTEEEVLNRLHSANRDDRRKASESLSAVLKDNTHILTYIYNMVLAEHRSVSKVRKYRHPMDARNLANETELSTIEGLVQSVKQAYPLVHRYYHLKRKLLGLDKLMDYDRMAPIRKPSEISFAECRRIVQEGYNEFSGEAGKITDLFFKNRWIDAEIRPGKTSGGFCCETIPDLHPYVLVNYTGNMRDVLTVAHELGHGLHQYLARGIGILESHAPLTMCETASVFGEMLIFEKLLSSEQDPSKRLSLLIGQIDDNFATVFRQIALTDFELLAHREGQKSGELSHEVLSELWLKASREMYGDSVTLSDAAPHGWKYIPHFYHTPFYCYAYSFAQLFVLSLFQKYKEDKTGFIPKYFEMLSTGGSKTPEEIAAICGIRLQDKNFWQGGLNLLDKLVSEAETLAADSLKTA